MAKILIVEDDKAIRMGLKDDLEFEGYEVSEASDGKEGLKAFIDKPVKPDKLLAEIEKVLGPRE